MKYFIVSDIHSCYRPLEKALVEKGFDINDPNHTLVVLGDVFDRGLQTRKVYDLLTTIPQERVILVKGNHEYLFEELLWEKKFPERHDFTNGTVGTFIQIAYQTQKTITKYMNILIDGYNSMHWTTIDDEFNRQRINKAKDAWLKIKLAVKNSEIYKWLISSKWQNYWETNKFIGVHSFIPIRTKDGYDSMYVVYNNLYGLMEYDPNWRDGMANWDSAVWGCPYKQFDYGLFKPEADKGKTLIVGHWHCSEFNTHYITTNKRLRTKMSNEYTPSPQDVLEDPNTIYYGKNLIAIDACTAASDKVNVLVIEDDEIIK